MLQSTGSRHMGLVVPRHMGSFQTRDQTHVLCIGRQILNHWTIREVPLVPAIDAVSLVFTEIGRAHV